MNTNTLTQIFFPALLVILFSSCTTKVDFEEFKAGMQEQFSKKDSTSEYNHKDISALVYHIYRENDFRPLWVQENGKTHGAENFLEEVVHLQNEGIPVARYHPDSLQQWIKTFEDAKGKPELQEAIALDKELTTVYVMVANSLLYGVLDPDDAVDMWYHDNDSTLKASDYFDDGKYAAFDNFRSKLPAYDALVRYRQQQSSDSIISVIDANLERLRWLPREFEEDYVLVVVPQMHLFLYDDRKEVMNMKTVVGRTDRETPSLNADMKNVVFNPSWGVPPGILKKDVIPGLLRSGEAYLDKKGLEVYDRQGNKVNAAQVNEENYKNYVFRQPPDERNALGQVKFDMPNPWAIYLHDTPSKGDFEKEERYKSSGCVRLHKPMDLADYILAEMNNKDYTHEEIKEITSHNDTEYVPLKNRLPVHIVYLTAYTGGDGNLQFYRDIYEKDMQLAGLLR